MAASAASAATTAAKRTVNSFVSTHWLASNLSNPAVKVVDASWFMPTAPEKGYEYNRSSSNGLCITVLIFDVCLMK
jgi:hypothetical protein